MIYWYTMQAPRYTVHRVDHTVVIEKGGAHKSVFKPLDVPLYTIKMSSTLGTEK